MPRYGFIRTKEEVKFLVLYAMDFLTEPISFDTVVDLCTWCDDGFGYFELNEAFYEMVETGHLQETSDSPALYTITARGRETAKVFEKRLPYTVREAAQRSALRVVRKLHRDAAVLTRTEALGTHDYVTHMEMDGVFSLRMNVVSEQQAAMLEHTFRTHAEQIYQVILEAMTRDYEPQEPTGNVSES